MVMQQTPITAKLHLQTLLFKVKLPTISEICKETQAIKKDYFVFAKNKITISGIFISIL